MALSIGDRIGNYRVLQAIASGGYGVVYQAVQEQIGTPVAIKVLHRELVNHSQDAVHRFVNEARVANRVRHPGIVRAFEFGQLAAGEPYIIMEFLDGTTLRQAVKRGGGGLPLQIALRYARQAASTLAAAHQEGVVHRDIKPDNLMIVPDPEIPGGDRVKLLDFGIAKFLDEPSGEGTEHPQTRPEARFGTPAYMSPEQCRSARLVDGRADVYSLGVVLYQILCGRLPFENDEAGAVMAMHIYELPRPVLDLCPRLPAALAGLIERMMAKAPTDRPAMTEVAALLDEIGGGGGIAGVPLRLPTAVADFSGEPIPPQLSPDATVQGIPAGVTSRDGMPAPPLRLPVVLTAVLALTTAVAGLLLWPRHVPVAAPNSGGRPAVVSEPALPEQERAAPPRAALSVGRVTATTVAGPRTNERQRRPLTPVADPRRTSEPRTESPLLVKPLWKGDSVRPPSPTPDQPLHVLPLWKNDD